MKKKIRKIGMLSSIALMICLGVTGCYPDGKVSLEEKKETDSNQINIDENASHIEGKLDEGLFVNAQTDIKSDADWHDNNVILKSWDVDKVSNVFGNGRNISENKTMPNMHNDNLNDNYIYWDDGSSIVIQNGNLQYNTKTELEYSYLGYLYGTMPYLTDETTEKFPETEISGIDKEAAIEQVKSILDEIGVEVSKPRVYSLTYEKLEENTDYSQTDPNGNAPHQWTKEDAAYAIVFKGTIDTLPITEVGYRSGPAAGERIVGIVGKQGLIAFHALNIYELETENELSDEILTTQTVLENIQQKSINIYGKILNYNYVYDYEYNEYQSGGYFSRLENSFNEDIIFEEPTLKYGEEPILNTIEIVKDVDLNRNILRFTKDTSTLSYSLDGINAKRIEKTAGSSLFNKEEWNDSFAKRKEIIMWIRVNNLSSNTNEINILSFGNETEELASLKIKNTGEVKFSCNGKIIDNMDIKPKEWNLIGISLERIDDSKINFGYFVNEYLYETPIECSCTLDCVHEH